MGTRKLALLILLPFISCDSANKKEVSMQESDLEKVGLYIYNSESNIPSDSLIVYSSSFEKSLELYKNVSQLEKEVSGLVYFSIFQLNDKKFSIIVDTSTIKVFEFTNDDYKRLLTSKCLIGVNGIKREEKDINSDGYIDVLLEIPSGGSFGSAFLCLFYNPASRKLVCDTTIELRNIILNLKERQLVSNSSMTSETYSIDKFKFRMTERVVDLSKTTGIKDFEDKIEVSKYSLTGVLISIDTIDHRKYYR